MSFFSKLNKEIDGLFGDEKKKKDQPPAESHGASSDTTRGKYNYSTRPRESIVMTCLYSS